MRELLSGEFDNVLDGSQFESNAILVRKWCEIETAVRERVSHLSDSLLECVARSEMEESMVRVHAETTKDIFDKKVTIKFQVRDGPTGEPIPLSQTISSVIVHTHSDMSSLSNQDLFKFIPPDSEDDVVCSISLKSLFDKDVTHATIFFNNQKSACNLRLCNKELQDILYHEYGLRAASPESWQCSRKSVILSVLAEYLIDNELLLINNMIKISPILRREMSIEEGVTEIEVSKLLRHVIRRLKPPGGFLCRLRLPGVFIADGPAVFATTNISDESAIWKSFLNTSRIKELDNELQQVLKETRACRKRRDHFLMFAESPDRAMHLSVKQELHQMYEEQNNALDEDDCEKAVELSALYSIKRHHCDDD